jgi:hypothetical protein
MRIGPVENRVSKAIFGTKRAEIKSELENSHKDELFNCTFIIPMAKEDGQDTLHVWERWKMHAKFGGTT